MKREKVAVRILGNNNVDFEEVRTTWNRFFDLIFVKKSISEAKYKESSENKMVGLEEKLLK